MLKVLLCLLTATAVAVALLQLRQQHLNLSYQTNRLHNQIEIEQARLWDQQLQIAVATAPSAMQQTLAQQDIHFVAPATPPDNLPSWTDLPKTTDTSAPAE
jgi:cell division protein FtsL